MPIHVDCPTCGQHLQVPNTAAGRTIQCASCGYAVRVTDPKSLLAAKLAGGSAGPARTGRNTGSTAANGARGQTGSKGAARDESEPFDWGDFWEGAKERLANGVEAISDRPVPALVVVLLFVAVALGVGAVRSAINKPSANGGVVAVASRVEQTDPEPWEGVGLTDSDGRVRVTATSVTTEQITVVPEDSTLAHKSFKAQLKIVLKIENLSPTPIQYAGWARRPTDTGHVATLTDDLGTDHPQVDWKERIVGQTTLEPIQPGVAVDDILVFPPPGTYTKYLKLALPAKAVGGTGLLRIKIPRTPFVD